MENIKLFKDGKVVAKDREFTRILGGFSDTSPMFTIFQAGELLGLRTSDVKDNFERNESNFELNVDYIDLKSATVSNVSENIVDIARFMKEIGYTQNKLNATKRWLAFSFSGMMKLVKIATTKESWNIYDGFLEDYFKTKAENIVMEKTLQETKDTLIEEQKYILGSVIIESDTAKKIDLLERSRNIEEQIKDIEVTLAKENLMKKVQDSIEIAERFKNSGNLYDVGDFSKILDIKGFGRNKLFEWMRENKMLMKNNKPYSSHMEYFKIVPVENNRFTNSKTLIKSQGISYIVKKLIKDGKIQEKTYESVIKDINDNLDVAS